MEENIKRRISAEPRYERVLYRILGECLQPVMLANLKEKIETYPEMHVHAIEPTTLIAWLVDVNALQELSAKTDVADEDSTNASNTDENIEPAEAGTSFVTTAKGAEAWQEREAADEFGILMESAGELKQTYHRVLELCRTPQSKKDLERTLVEEGLLDLEQRQVSSYLDKLEKAEGVVWDKGWTTTERGLAQIV